MFTKVASALLISLSLSAAATGSASWEMDDPVAGSTVTVDVGASDCFPIKLVFKVGGEIVGTADIDGPGSYSLPVPAGASGQSYSLTLSCGGESDSKSGTVF